MTDFPNQNETPYYEPLTPGISFPQNNPTPDQPSIQENKTNNNNGNDVVYRAPSDLPAAFILSFFFIFGIGASIIFFIIMLFTKNLGFIGGIIISLVGAVIIFFVGRTITINAVINISSTLGTITIKKIKLFFCYNYQEIVQINEVQQIIIEDQEGLFYLKFILLDGKQVYGLNGIYNKNDEGRKALEFMRNALPERISFKDNLSVNSSDIDLRNIK